MTTVDPALDLLARLHTPNAEVLALLAGWHDAPTSAPWRHDVRLYRGFAKVLISAGHPTRAFELAREGLAIHANDPTLVYLSALALVRGRNPAKAEDYLAPLLK